MASYPTYNPSIYSGHVTTKRLAAQGLTPSTAEQRNFPSLDRASDGVYPAGSTFKPVTALAAMETGKLLALDARCRARARTRSTASSTAASPRCSTTSIPYINESMTLPTALAASCDTWFYRARLRVLQGARERGAPAPGVGGEVRLRAQDRRRRRPRVARAAADARMAQAELHGQDRPGQLADRQPVEARRLDPAGDRAEGPARHAAADGPLLLADRQRRQARAAAPGAAGRGGRRNPALAAACRAHLPLAGAAVGRPQPDLPRGRAGRALAGDALQGRDLDERVRQLPDPDRRQDGHGAEGTRAPTRKTSPGGAGTGRPRATRRPSSSSAP